MNKNFTINSSLFTISAFTIGLILCDDLTPAEQNSLGNWFMLVGQALCTNSSQQQVINNKLNKSNNTNSHIINDDTINNAAKTIKKEINNIFSK